MKINPEKMRETVASLPKKVASLDDIPDQTMACFYTETEAGTFELDVERRERLVGIIDKQIEENKTKRAKDASDRARVIAVVRESLADIVRPELLDAAVSHFLATHEFNIREDGEVVVRGEYITEDAQSAAARFANNAGAPLTDEAIAPATYVSALRSLH